MRKARHPPAQAPEIDDSTLFRAAVGKIRELEVIANPLQQSRTLPAAVAAQSQADERRVLDELLTQDVALVGAASGEVLQHLQDGYPPKLLRQLRRGQFRVEAELDLHHLRVHEARHLLAVFLLECRRNRLRCVRVIHGKGKRSADGSVIKALTDRVLRQRAEVIGYISARPEDGGTGAVMVLLLRPPGKKRPVRPCGTSRASVTPAYSLSLDHFAIATGAASAMPPACAADLTTQAWSTIHPRRGARFWVPDNPTL